MSCYICQSNNSFCKCNCGKNICSMCIIDNYIMSHQFSCNNCNMLYDTHSIFKHFPSFFSNTTNKLVFFINNQFSSLLNYKKMRSPFKTAAEKYKDDKLSSHIRKKNELQHLLSSVTHESNILSHTVRDRHLREIKQLNNTIDHLFTSKKYSFTCPRCASELCIEDCKYVCRFCNTTCCSKCYHYLNPDHKCSKPLTLIFNKDQPEIYSSYHFNHQEENKIFISLFKAINELVNNPYFNSSLIDIIHNNYRLPRNTVVSKKYTFTFDSPDDFLLSVEFIRMPIKTYVYISIVKNVLKIFMNKLHSTLLRDHFDKNYHLNSVLELNEKLERMSRACEMPQFTIEL